MGRSDSLLSHSSLLPSFFSVLSSPHPLACAVSRPFEAFSSLPDSRHNCLGPSGERLCGALPVLTAGREENKQRRREGKENGEGEGDEGGRVVDKISVKNSNITSLTAHNIAEVEKEINDSVTDKQTKGVIKKTKPCTLCPSTLEKLFLLFSLLAPVFFSLCWQTATFQDRGPL